MNISAHDIELKLREQRLPEYLVQQCGSLAHTAAVQRIEIDALRREIEFLKRHVPEEIRNPPKPVPLKDRRYHGD